MDSVFQVILIAILENIFPEKCLTFPENGLPERLEFRKYWMCKAFAGIFVFKGIIGRLKMRKFILLSGVDRRGARVYSKQSDAEIHIFLKKTCAGPPRRRPAGSAGKMKNQFEDLTRRVIRSSIDWSGVGLRLDDYLAARFTYRSADEWRERIARREILVNDLPAEPERILALHDRLEYFPGDLPEPEAELSYRIAYEDDELLIVDKPGNLCVHPSGPFFRHTLWHMLCSVYGKIHLVNRLDRETSGLLIAAKNPKVAAKLGQTLLAGPEGVSRACFRLLPGAGRGVRLSGAGYGEPGPQEAPVRRRGTSSRRSCGDRVGKDASLPGEAGPEVQHGAGRSRNRAAPPDSRHAVLARVSAAGRQVVRAGRLDLSEDPFQRHYGRRPG